MLKRLIDPDGESLQRARARRNGTVIGLSQARAEALPFADESFDAVVGTLTFCSIGDPARALNEVRRVLKAGGALRLVEHVRMQNRFIAAMQDVLTPMWCRIAGNCHLNRDTLMAVEQAGFRVRRVHWLMGDLFIGIDAFK
jgi:ubiquinone/menaquinone biosynthesis C-methylase UbiE